jgi:hypothetical protein
MKSWEKHGWHAQTLKDSKDSKHILCKMSCSQETGTQHTMTKRFQQCPRVL